MVGMPNRDRERVEHVSSFIPKSSRNPPRIDQSIFKAAFKSAYRSGLTKKDAVAVATAEVREWSPSFQPELLEGFWEA